MSGFSSDWLTLREPADRAARSHALVERLCARAPGARLTVVDLGAGTGANLRYLAPRLGGEQRWLLVDDDAALLTAARGALAAWAAESNADFVSNEHDVSITAHGFACSVRTLELDLARSLGALTLPPACLVTASALLDLVSADWLESLAESCAQARASVLFALIYDGRIEPAPAQPDDRLALECFNRHQRGDKGFGPALGPRAADAALDVFAARGYALAADASDWRLDARSADLQRALVDGWHAAAAEIAPEHAARLARWRARRRALVDRGAKLVVGHRDLRGLPPLGSP